MKASSRLSSPVITLLAGDTAASRRTQKVLQSLFALKEINFADKEAWETDENDLNSSFFLRGLNRKWVSTASQCGETGAIIHILSLDSEVEQQTVQSDQSAASPRPLSLLAISGDTFLDDKKVPTAEVLVRESRQILASHMKKNLSRGTVAGLVSSIKSLFGSPLTANQIIGNQNGGLPLLNPPLCTRHEADVGASKKTRPPMEKESPRILRELSIPHFDEATYSDGSTLLSCFSNSPALFSRPVVGVYQWPSRTNSGNGVCIRPLPSAKEDRSLPPPSFVFQCDSLDKEGKRVMAKSAAMGGGQNNKTATAKIGFNGARIGQLMVFHPDLEGIDVRVCQSVELSSTFAEAQEALMASSLDELQAANVLVEGGESSKPNNDGTVNVQTTDSRNGFGDCWMEFRANARQPSGFLKRARPSSNDTKRNDRVAKPPDLPFE